MKKLLLMSAVLLYCSGTFAQQARWAPKRSTLKIKSNSSAPFAAHKAIPKTIGASVIEGIPFNTNPSRPVSRLSSSNSVLSVNETLIGNTTYDLQTNGTISNRLVLNSDASVSATWTMSLTATYPDRGTGYNYYTGSAWGAIPTVRTEAFRTGFTNIAVSPSGAEASDAHSVNATNGIAFTSRAAKGTGAWATAPVFHTDATTLWPKMAAGGSNGTSFHTIYTTNVSTSGPMYYSRSLDNGATWSDTIQIPGWVMGVDNFKGVGGDSYSIDVRGNIVAIVVGDLGGTDLVLLKSTDNGATFTKTVIYQFPIPLYDEATMTTDINSDGIADTLFTPASDQAVVIDGNGKVHVTFGGERCIEAAGATALSYFVAFDMYYWNESMGTNNFQYVASPPDLDGDGLVTIPTGCGFDPANNPVGYYATGLPSYILMPSMAVDASNNLYVSYMAADELSDTAVFGQDFMHIYMIKSLDGGDTWTNSNSALDIVKATQPASEADLDGAFAALAKSVDGSIHLTYQRDGAPGTTLSGTNDPCSSANNGNATNDIIYITLSPSDILTNPSTGISNAGNISSFSVSANYPNPFNGSTSVDVNLTKTSNVTIEVSNMVGQVMSTMTYENLNAGKNTLTINGSSLAKGLYVYKVKAGEEVVTRTMSVQ